MSLKKCIILGIFLVVIFLFLVNVIPNKEFEDIEDLENISAPVQTSTSGNLDMELDDWDVDINYIAEYSISGRVVDVQDYHGFSFTDQLSPVDIGISWGFLANEENLTWYSSGDRFLNWRAETTLINKLGGKNRIARHFSNNHLIPSDKEIKKLIKAIKENDYIKIEGYLVNIYATKEDGSYRYWNSSTSRTDTGDGACEIIYVKNIKWLNEK